MLHSGNRVLCRECAERDDVSRTICVLPGWRVSRTLGRGELCAPGAGFVFCPRCRSKYEVVRCEEREAA